uniref:Uncharacterized protein n=1 Tax=Manihot esculenta TaxID=3983 RepID=A0A2C9WFR8_MANES
MANLKSHLQTLYAQPFWITLASSLMLISQILSLLLFQEKKFTTRRPSTYTQYCSVRLLPIAKILYCWHILTRYSLVRHCKYYFPSDLYVLSISPLFILSQNRTLHKILMNV